MSKSVQFGEINVLAFFMMIFTRANLYLQDLWARMVTVVSEGPGDYTFSRVVTFKIPADLNIPCSSVEVNPGSIELEETVRIEGEEAEEKGYTLEEVRANFGHCVFYSKEKLEEELEFHKSCLLREDLTEDKRGMHEFHINAGELHHYSLHSHLGPVSDKSRPGMNPGYNSGNPFDLGGNWVLLVMNFTVDEMCPPCTPDHVLANRKGIEGGGNGATPETEVSDDLYADSKAYYDNHALYETADEREKRLARQMAAKE